jgi:predicted ester cyclase
MNLPPTGKSITMTGIEIFRIEDGKVAELWAEANLIGLMQQLGAFPAFNQ